MGPDGDTEFAGIQAVVAVHRLRDVACLYGFTRFEPAPLANDDLEDVGLAVRGAPLGDSPDWLPAIEQFGEGVFIQFSPEALSAWLSRSSVLERSRQLQAGALKWAEAKRAAGSAVSRIQLTEHARPEYIMAHSLSHSLMSEVAIDCGYPATALKERIYVPRLTGEAIQCGVLIYTASAGNQGTLGGLVEVTQRFGRILKSALNAPVFAPATRSALTTIRSMLRTTECSMAPPAMAASSFRKHPVTRATSRSTGGCSSTQSEPRAPGASEVAVATGPTVACCSIRGGKDGVGAAGPRDLWSHCGAADKARRSSGCCASVRPTQRSRAPEH